MTLESDVIDILLQNSRLRPSQIRKILLSLPGYNNKNTQGKRNRLLDVQINRLLTHLVEDDYILREDVKHGEVRYSLTKKGRKKAPSLSMRDKATDPQRFLEVSFQEILKAPINTHDISDEKTIQTLHEIQPEGTAPIQVAFWLDQENQSQVDAVIKNLQKDVDRSLIPNIDHLASNFAFAVKNALADAKNLWYEDEGPLRMQKLVRLAKESLNFDAMVCFRFNGKQIVANLDWDKYKAHYEKPDRQEEEKYEKFRKGVNGKGETRKAWIRTNILKKAREAQDNFGKNVLSKTFRRLDYKEVFEFEEGEWKLMLSPSSSESLLMNEYAERRLSAKMREKAGLGSLPDPPSIDECKEAFESLQKEGALEIVPVYFYKVNRKNGNRAFQRDVRKVYDETGYSLDDIALGVSEMRRFHDEQAGKKPSG